MGNLLWELDNLVASTESLSGDWASLCVPPRIRGRAGVNIELMIGAEDDIDRWREYC